jgi:hypothetical protein
MKMSLNSYSQFRSERELFLHITQNRTLGSFVSGVAIGPDVQAWNFAHVLPKRKNAYPHFKLYEKNIVLLTYEEHETWDRKRFSIDVVSEHDWQKLIELERELKVEYRQLFGIGFRKLKK